MESTSDDQKSLVPADDTSLSRRSIEVTRTCINRGQGTSRALWVSIRPQNPVLKAVVAVPAAVIMLSVLILFMMIAGFTLLAAALILMASGKQRK